MLRFQNLDLINKKVSILQGFKKSTHNLKYDHLVIALGQVSNLEIVKGLKDHGFTMRSLQDAYDLRNHILGCLELADVTSNKELKKIVKYSCNRRRLFWSRNYWRN